MSKCSATIVHMSRLMKLLRKSPSFDADETSPANIRRRLIHIEQKIDDLLSRVNGSGSRDHPDQAFGRESFAQHGEDMIVMNILHALGIARPTYLDIGAHHPVNISNTALLYKLGGRGVNVEANPDLIGAFHEQRPEDTNLNVGVGAKPGTMPFYRIDNWSGRNSFDRATVDAFVRSNPDFALNDTISVDVVTPREIVETWFHDRPLNFLSLDVEGRDLEILEVFPFDIARPDIICVEVLSGDGTDLSAEMSRVLAGQDYCAVSKTVGNIIYVQKDKRDVVLPR